MKNLTKAILCAMMSGIYFCPHITGIKDTITKEARETRFAIEDIHKNEYHFQTPAYSDWRNWQSSRLSLFNTLFGIPIGAGFGAASLHYATRKED